MSGTALLVPTDGTDHSGKLPAWTMAVNVDSPIEMQLARMISQQSWILMLGDVMALFLLFCFDVFQPCGLAFVPALLKPALVAAVHGGVPPCGWLFPAVE